jgi:hypothetical protein
MGLDYIWETVNCSNCVTVYKVNFLLEQLQEIQNLLGGSPQTPLDGSHLRRSTRLSQNPSYGPDLLPCDVYLLVKPCIHMLVAAVTQTCRL